MPTTVDEDSTFTVAIRVDDPRWHAIDISKRARTACRATMGVAVPGGAWPSAARLQISLLATNDATIQELNRQFRNRDHPTDILSFPASTPPVPDRPHDTFLGDMALGFESCRKGAAAASGTLDDHIGHLVIHGCLHLLGFDHDTEENFRKMRLMERRALAMIRDSIS